MAKADTQDFFDRVMLAEEDVAERFELCALHGELVPIVGTVAARGLGLADGLQLDAQLPANAVKIGEGEHALYFYVIGLVQAIPAFQKLRGEVAVVGEKDQARGRVFEIADRENAFRKTAKEIAKSFAAFGVSE